MLKLHENGLNIDYMYETNSVLRKTAETEISDLTFWLRFGSVQVFINRNRTEIRFPHIPNMESVQDDVSYMYSAQFEQVGKPCVCASDRSKQYLCIRIGIAVNGEQ